MYWPYAEQIHPQSQKRREKSQKRQIVLNVADTKYTVVRRVARKILGWRLSRDAYRDDWDVLWSDSAVAVERLAKMKRHQKVNHFPGMFGISRKDCLARNLNRLRSVYPSEYDFYPRTWLIPADLLDFKAYAQSNKSACFIVKPEASSQGKGIYLIRRAEELASGARCVVQTYISKPWLIDGLKFDLRLYVLVTGCEPLRIYVHEEGLTRLATERYEEPRYENMSEVCMHLTNYAVNKNSEKFTFNTGTDEEEVGHKRSLAATFQRLEEDGRDIDEIWRNICDLIIKTLCAVQPTLTHTYKSAQPDDSCSSMCFELLGFDILLDSAMKPWLLEVNHSPSFTVDTPLDDRVKTTVISDTFRMLGVTMERRKRVLSEQKLAVQRNRLVRTISERRKERKSLATEAQSQKDEFESRNSGGFTCIYPIERGEVYGTYMEAAGRLWDNWTSMKSRSAVLDSHPSTTEKLRKSRLRLSDATPKCKEKPAYDRLHGSTRLNPPSESPPGLAERMPSRPQTSSAVKHSAESLLTHIPVVLPANSQSDLPIRKRECLLCAGASKDVTSSIANKRAICMSASELLIQTTVSLLYQSWFCGGMSIAVEGGEVREKRGRKERVQKKPRGRRRAVDPALEELIFSSEADELVIPPPRKLLRKTAAVCYREVVLEEERKDAETAQMIVDAIVSDLRPTQKHTEIFKVTAVPKQKPRAVTTILGVLQTKYSTIRTVELPTATEMQPREQREDRNEDWSARETVKYRLLTYRTASLRTKGSDSFEKLRMMETG